MKTAEDIVKNKNMGLITIPSDKTVLQACRLMVDNKIGAVLIEKNDDIVGIWSERDLLQNILKVGFDPETARVGTYMTTPLHCAPFDAPIHKLEDMFMGLRIRHILIEKEEKYIGLLSIGDVIRANLIEKEQRFKELNSFTSWKYYEDWKWDRVRK